MVQFQAKQKPGTRSRSSTNHSTVSPTLTSSSQPSTSKPTEQPLFLATYLPAKVAVGTGARQALATLLALAEAYCNCCLLSSGPLGSDYMGSVIFVPPDTSSLGSDSARTCSLSSDSTDSISVKSSLLSVQRSRRHHRLPTDQRQACLRLAIPPHLQACQDLVPDARTVRRFTSYRFVSATLEIFSMSLAVLSGHCMKVPTSRANYFRAYFGIT